MWIAWRITIQVGKIECTKGQKHEDQVGWSAMSKVGDGRR